MIVWYICKTGSFDGPFLHQKHGGAASCVGDFTCANGWCSNNPCLNGGTCNEICEPTSVRYNCSCPEHFVGRHCATQTRSCQDYKAAGVDKSGLYEVIDNTNQTLQVFCDFNSEPGFAWNLVESFSLSNKHLFQVNILNELEENILHVWFRMSNSRASVPKRYYTGVTYKEFLKGNREHHFISHKKYLANKTIFSFLMAKQLFQFRFLE